MMLAAGERSEDNVGGSVGGPKGTAIKWTSLLPFNSLPHEIKCTNL